MWKHIAETLFVVKGVTFESEAFFNSQIWINSGSDLRHDMSFRIWSMAGTFINKSYMLKSSELEKLIFILADPGLVLTLLVYKLQFWYLKWCKV